jgi:hypothetical protein
MTDLRLSKEIAKILPDYGVRKISLNCDSVFGIKELEEKRFKIDNKSEIITGDRVIFISSEMYPGTDRNFRYAINYTKAKIRMYRCRTWNDIEYDKKYVSAKTDKELIEKIKEQFN